MFTNAGIHRWCCIIHRRFSCISIDDISILDTMGTLVFFLWKPFRPHPHSCPCRSSCVLVQSTLPSTSVLPTHVTHFAFILTLACLCNSFCPHPSVLPICVTHLVSTLNTAILQVNSWILEIQYIKCEIFNNNWIQLLSIIYMLFW